MPSITGLLGYATARRHFSPHARTSQLDAPSPKSCGIIAPHAGRLRRFRRFANAFSQIHGIATRLLHACRTYGDEAAHRGFSRYIVCCRAFHDGIAHAQTRARLSPRYLGMNYIGALSGGRIFERWPICDAAFSMCGRYWRYRRRNARNVPPTPIIASPAAATCRFASSPLLPLDADFTRLVRHYAPGAYHY